MDKTYSYYIPQNTGFTNKTSWFDTGSVLQSRCKTLEEAIVINKEMEKDCDDSISFRVVFREVKETYYY